MREKYVNHWWGSDPIRASGYRAILLDGQNIDPLVIKAARMSNIPDTLLRKIFDDGTEISLYCDPNIVQSRIGPSDKGASLQTLYEGPKNHYDGCQQTIKKQQSGPSKVTVDFPGTFPGPNGPIKGPQIEVPGDKYTSIRMVAVPPIKDYQAENSQSIQAFLNHTRTFANACYGVGLYNGKYFPYQLQFLPCYDFCQCLLLSYGSEKLPIPPPKK